MTLAFLTNGLQGGVRAHRLTAGGSAAASSTPSTTRWPTWTTVLRMVLYFRPLKIFLPLAGLAIGLGVVYGGVAWRTSGSLSGSPWQPS